MKHHYSAALILGAILVGVCLVYQNQKAPVARHERIVIGVASGYVPWATRNDAGELEGFDVDIARELAARLNLPLTLVDMSPEMLMASVRAKKIDCMIAPMAITPEREKAYRMIHYQGSAAGAWPVMMQADNQSVLHTLEDAVLQQASVGVLSGTKQSEYALSIEALDVHTYDSMAHILMALRTGKVTYALVDPDLGKQLVADSPDMKVVLINVPAEYQSLGNGIACNLDNGALAERIRTVIDTMKDEGLITRAEEKWHIGRLT